MRGLKIIRSLWALRESLVFQLGVWALAVAMCISLASALRERSRADTLRDELSLPTLDVRPQTLRKEDYLAVRERLAKVYADRGVVISAGDDGVTIKAKNLGDYAEWRVALADVMLAMPGALWNVKKLCAGQKCPEFAYSVTLTGMVRNFAVSLPRPALAGAAAQAEDASLPATR